MSKSIVLAHPKKGGGGGIVPLLHIVFVQLCNCMYTAAAGNHKTRLQQKAESLSKWKMAYDKVLRPLKRYTMYMPCFSVLLLLLRYKWTACFISVLYCFDVYYILSLLLYMCGCFQVLLVLLETNWEKNKRDFPREGALKWKTFCIIVINFDWNSIIYKLTE